MKQTFTDKKTGIYLKTSSYDSHIQLYDPTGGHDPLFKRLGSKTVKAYMGTHTFRNKIHLPLFLHRMSTLYRGLGLLSLFALILGYNPLARHERTQKNL